MLQSDMVRQLSTTDKMHKPCAACNLLAGYHIANSKELRDCARLCANYATVTTVPRPATLCVARCSLLIGTLVEKVGWRGSSASHPFGCARMTVVIQPHVMVRES